MRGGSPLLGGPATPSLRYFDWQATSSWVAFFHSERVSRSEGQPLQSDQSKYPPRLAGGPATPAIPTVTGGPATPVVIPLTMPLPPAGIDILVNSLSPVACFHSPSIALFVGITRVPGMAAELEVPLVLLACLQSHLPRFGKLVWWASHTQTSAFAPVASCDTAARLLEDLVAIFFHQRPLHKLRREHGAKRLCQGSHGAMHRASHQ